MLMVSVVPGCISSGWTFVSQDRTRGWLVPMDACTAKKSVKELSETVQVLSVHVEELRNATVFPKITLLGKFPQARQTPTGTT